MTIHPRPDQEQTIQQALQAGLIATAEEALDVGIPTLRERLQRNTGGVDARERNLSEVFEPVRGLAGDLDTRRNPSAEYAQERLEALLLEGLDGEEAALSPPDAFDAIRRKALGRLTGLT